MKPLNLLYLSIGFLFGIALGIRVYSYSSKSEPKPTPEPFQLETIQLQRGNTLITVCIDKNKQQAVPCTAYFLPL